MLLHAVCGTLCLRLCSVFEHRLPVDKWGFDEGFNIRAKCVSWVLEW